MDSYNKIKTYKFIILFFIYTIIISRKSFAYVHSSFYYSGTNKCIQVEKDDKLPQDLSKCKICLMKGQDPEHPLNTLIEGGDEKYLQMTLTDNYLYVRYYKEVDKETSQSPMGYVEYGIRIIDVTDRNHPILKGSFIGGAVTVVKDKIIFVSTGYAGKNSEIWDVSDANQPVKRGEFPYKGKKIVQSDKMYMLTEDKFLVIDITDPIRYRLISSADFPISIEGEPDYYIEGDKLYIIENIKEEQKFSLSFYDIAQPQAPYLIRRYVHEANTEGEGSFLTSLSFENCLCNASFFRDQLLYIVGSPRSLFTYIYCYRPAVYTDIQILDLSDPLNLKKIGEEGFQAKCDINDTACVVNEFSDIYVQGNYAYLLRDFTFISGKTNNYTHYGQDLHVVELSPRPEQTKEVFWKRFLLNGTGHSDYIIKDNFGYFSLYEGGGPDY